jgi:PAS domain S-box-containing protein
MHPNGGHSLRDAVNGLVRDMVVQNSANAMLLAQNRALAEELPIGMFECEPEGSVIWVNRYLRRLCGLRMEQMKGSGWLNGLHNEDRRRVENDWMLATMNQRPFLTTFRISHFGNGAILNVQCEAAPIFQGTKCMGWIGMIRPWEFAEAA